MSADELRALIHDHIARAQRLNLARPAPPACATCADTGWREVTIERGNGTAAERCTECDRGKSIKLACVHDLPAEFVDARLGNYPIAAYNADAVASMRELVAGTRDHIFLSGAPGVGKTRLAASGANEFADQGIGGAFISLDWLFRISQRAISDPTKRAEADALESRVFDTPIVILDDVPGVESPTDFTHGFLLRILERRFNRRLVTIITSNFSPKDLETFFRDTRIMSRIVGNCGEAVEINGPDHRLARTHAGRMRVVPPVDARISRKRA